MTDVVAPGATDIDVLRLKLGLAVWREIDGETVVLDVASAVYLATNASGTTLWRSLVEGATRPQLIKLLIDTYGIDEDTAATSVDAFVDACRQRGFLEG